MKRFYVFPILMLFASTIGFSQTREQIAKFTTYNNTKELVEIKERATQKFEEMKRNAFRKNIPMMITDGKGKRSLLQSFDPDGTPVYVSETNVDAAISTRTNFLHSGGGLGLNLEGNNMTAHVWEVFSPRPTHQEFDGPGGTNRLTQMDEFNFYGDHANHVIGTIMAAGINPNAKGMAPSATVEAYTALNDEAEVVNAAMQGMLISNHSYERMINTEIGVNPNLFGTYNLNAKVWDEIMYNAPYYLQVKSAGNNGDDNTMNSQPLNGNSRYDKLLDESNSKNNLIIANYNDMEVDENGVFTSLPIRNFESSEGPTDDLRVKPDLAGNGIDLFSPIVASDNSYATLTGTSMSSPNVAGSLLLLQEHYQNITGNFMRAATLKGLALHTADNIGVEGPDARGGWGYLNSKKAAEAITNSGTTSLVEELYLYNTQIYTITVEANGLEDLMASISWTDVPGNSTIGVNDPTPALVNDLDIRITQSGTTYEPYRLLSETTNGRGDNDRDPFERIDVSNASGTYTITVTHKGTMINNTQAFSLILTGIEAVVEAGELSMVDIIEFPYFERFENGFGAWLQSSDDGLDWTLNSGPTPTEATGPLAASQGDFYAFVESTRDGEDYSYQYAYLNSPRFVIGDTNKANVTFSYHQNGTGLLGKLYLEMRVHDDFWLPVWTSNSNNIANDWQTITVDLTQWLNWLNIGESVELRFSRELGFSEVADLAIDNIAVNIGAGTVNEPEGYCDIVFDPIDDDNFYEWIGGVEHRGISNVSGSSENGYSDFTGLQQPAAVIAPGNIGSITITPKWLDESYFEDYAVYIDYNRDGDFDDPNELAFSKLATDKPSVFGIIFTPQDIGYGRSRMRVIMHWDVIEGPCGPFQYGEVEDYSVILMGDEDQGNDYPYYKNSEVSKLASSIQMYPNPVTDNILNVRVLENNATQYMIYNSLGQVLDQGQYTEQINVSRLAKGMYFLELHTPDQKFIERFIKK